VALTGVLIDTNAYAAFKRGLPEAVDVIQHVPLVGLSTIVLGELLGGFALGRRSQENRRELNAFLSSDRVRIFAVDADTATHYATVYQHLRSVGRPIPTNDMWIAAVALQHDLAVFSYDGHFAEVPGIVAGMRLPDLLTD
jgi:predicted nucleic acid-binding protein